MSWAEDVIKEKYELMGYDVIGIGKPDLILLKDGEIEFVEVKTAYDKLQRHQLEAIALLTAHGFKARMERISYPKISSRRISKKEQSEIIRQYHNDELEPRDLYHLIVRAQRTRGMTNFVQLLIYFFNTKNDEDNTDTFSWP